MTYNNNKEMVNLWKPGSSDVDWCEVDYEYSKYIAEFYNTISNMPFIILPPLMIHLFCKYARKVDKSVNVVWVLLIVVGLGSGYFHATLSFSGQLLDELAILYVLMAALALWAPEHWFRWMGSRLVFKKFMCGVAVVATRVAFLYPALNAFALMTVAVPVLALIVCNLRRCCDPAAWHLASVSVSLWLLAVLCWVNDKFACDFWGGFSFPYPQLHSMWHVLILVASCTGCTLGAYFFAVVEAPQLQPRLVYWPNTSWCVGIPYVALGEVFEAVDFEKIL